MDTYKKQQLGQYAYGAVDSTRSAEKSKFNPVWIRNRADRGQSVTF